MDTSMSVEAEFTTGPRLTGADQSEYWGGSSAASCNAGGAGADGSWPDSVPHAKSSAMAASDTRRPMGADLIQSPSRSVLARGYGRGPGLLLNSCARRGRKRTWRVRV